MIYPLYDDKEYVRERGEGGDDPRNNLPFFVQSKENQGMYIFYL